MNRTENIKPEFVEYIPNEIEPGVLYISEKYETAIHKCCCGCGEEVVTPLTPVKWLLRRKGNLVTLYPSIGNWTFKCKSHYWIRQNKVEWAGQLTDKQIRRVQQRDQDDNQIYIGNRNANLKEEKSILRKIARVLKSLF